MVHVEDKQCSQERKTPKTRLRMKCNLCDSCMPMCQSGMIRMKQTKATILCTMCGIWCRGCERLISRACAGQVSTLSESYMYTNVDSCSDCQPYTILALQPRLRDNQQLARSLVPYILSFNERAQRLRGGTTVIATPPEAEGLRTD